MSRIHTISRYWRAILMTGVLAVALAVGLPVLTSDSAEALESAPVPVSGEFTNEGIEVIEDRIAGANRIITQTGTQTFTGGMEGTFDFEQTVVIHLRTGEVKTEATGTFTGKVAGKQGTHVSSIEAEGNVNFVTGVGFIQGEFEILSGTYGTESIHGQGTFEASATPMALGGAHIQAGYISIRRGAMKPSPIVITIRTDYSV